MGASQPDSSTQTATDQPPQPDEVQGSAAPAPDDAPADPQQERLDELEKLHSDGVLTDEQYDDAKQRIESGASRYDKSQPDHAWGNVPGINTPPGPTQAEIDAVNATQGLGAGSVPEVRPQGFQQPSGGISDASKRLDNPQAHGPEEIAAANSQANKDAAAEASRTPNLLVGTRVQLTDPHSEAGRMAYVQSVVYKDGIQQMLANSDTPERRFAEVLQYVVVTRDGRTDTLTATPEEVKPLDTIQGWGRGQI